MFKVTVSPVGIAAPEAPVTDGEEVLKEADAVEFVPSYSFVKWYEVELNTLYILVRLPGSYALSKPLPVP